MALSTEQIRQLREHLENCKKPLFFFDDDQDGLCSFLQLYCCKREGKGVIIKTTPKIGTVFLKQVQEYNPDKLFILDIAVVEQDFLDEMKVPVIWIDHHGPFERQNVKYFNPRVSNQSDNQPTSYLCHQIVSHGLSETSAEHSKYLWMATLGCVADWFIPPFIKEFKNEFSDLIDYPYKGPGDILYNTKLGHLIRIFSFILKGKTNDVMKSIKVLTRIKNPYEILEQKSAQGRFICKRYEQMNELYEPLIKDAIQSLTKTSDEFVFFIYKDDKSSFTSDLSNEAIYRHPDKTILIGREKNGEMKCSIRSTKFILPPLIEKSLEGLQGYGGGHEYACGLSIKKSDFEEFIRRFKEMI